MASIPLGPHSLLEQQAPTGSEVGKLEKSSVLISVEKCSYGVKVDVDVFENRQIRSKGWVKVEHEYEVQDGVQYKSSYTKLG